MAATLARPDLCLVQQPGSSATSAGPKLVHLGRTAARCWLVLGAAQMVLLPLAVALFGAFLPGPHTGVQPAALHSELAFAASTLASLNVVLALSLARALQQRRRNAALQAAAQALRPHQER